MSRWLTQVEVLSPLKVPDDTVRLHYGGAVEKREVFLENAPDDALDHNLVLSVIYDADDIDDATDKAHLEASEVLENLSFVTRVLYKIIRRKFVMDWSEGPTNRKLAVFFRNPKRDVLGELNSEMMASAKTIEDTRLGQTVKRVMHWFSTGLNSSLPEDQFQCFWFTIEVAVGGFKAQRETDKCQRCRTDLYCPECDAPSTHRPFPSQRIKQHLESVGISQQLAESLTSFRNKMMHGATREELESYAKSIGAEDGVRTIVEMAGEAAWRMIHSCMKFPEDQEKTLYLLEPDSLVRVNLEVVLQGNVEFGGDPNNPQLDDIVIPIFTTSVMRRDAEGNEEVVTLE